MKIPDRKRFLSFIQSLCVSLQQSIRSTHIFRQMNFICSRQMPFDKRFIKLKIFIQRTVFFGRALLNWRCLFFLHWINLIWVAFYFPLQHGNQNILLGKHIVEQ